MTLKTRRFLTFNLGEKLYGVEITYVNSIIEKNMPITRVPSTPNYIEGVINLRGDVIPVMDLRKRMEMEQAEHTEETRIIIVDKAEIVVGLIVDRIKEVLGFDDTHIETISEQEQEDKTYDMFHGIGKHGEEVIALFSIDKIIEKQGL